MAADEKWYFTKEQLGNTPSRKCGIDADKELSYRQQAANFIQDMGQRLSVYPFFNRSQLSPFDFRGKKSSITHRVSPSDNTIFSDCLVERRKNHDIFVHDWTVARRSRARRSLGLVRHFILTLLLNPLSCVGRRSRLSPRRRVSAIAGA